MSDTKQINKRDLIEEIIGNFLSVYPWFERRLVRMDEAHRNAIGVLMEEHPSVIPHIMGMLDKNLDEDKFDMLTEGKWQITQAEYVLVGMLALLDDGDEVEITDYVKGSGIIGLDGNELDSSTLKL